jgi:hypothetical protein
MLQKVNKVIEYANQIGVVTNDTLTQWGEVIEWVTNEGLEETATNTINSLISDGTLGNLINDGLLGNVLTQLGSKALASDVNTLKTQIQTIIANSTTTEGNTELIDGRLSANGRNYTTLGSRLRIGDDFESYTRTLSTDYVSYVPTLQSNQYVDSNTLALTDHSGYVLTIPIECQYGDEFLVSTVLFGPLVSTAVLYDANKTIIGVRGAKGNSTTDPQTSLIRVDMSNCKYIAFQCQSTNRATLSARKKKAKGDTIETMKRTRGYYHVNAKARAGMSDRAQVWLTYDLGVGATVNPFTIPFEIISNLSGVSYRLFGGLTTKTYEAYMEYYSGWVGEGTYNYIGTGKSLVMPNDPTTSAPTRYLQIFIDLILTDQSKVGEIYIPKFKVNGKEPIREVLNLGSVSDKWNNVVPFAERSPLYKKKMVGIGDSLMYGSVTGNQITWLNKLGAKYDMDYYNYGDNGNPIADVPSEPTETGMVKRYTSMVDGADYIIVLGGANDRRLNVPLGTNTSTDITTFKGALNVLIDGLISKYPKGKILFMTNYNRFPSTVNSLGYSDIQYVDAMIEICNLKDIQCFDNYRKSGINFQNPITANWQDEGITIDGNANVHLSDEAYTWLLPKYEQALSGL